MKVLLYLEAEDYLRKSGIGRAIKHQERALTIVGQEYTTNSKDDYDLVHINTYGLKSWHLLMKSKRAGKKCLCTVIQPKRTFVIHSLVQI